MCKTGESEKEFSLLQMLTGPGPSPDTETPRHIKSERERERERERGKIVPLSQNVSQFLSLLPYNSSLYGAQSKQKSRSSLQK